MSAGVNTSEGGVEQAQDDCGLQETQENPGSSLCIGITTKCFTPPEFLENVDIKQQVAAGTSDYVSYPTQPDDHKKTPGLQPNVEPTANDKHNTKPHKSSDVLEKSKAIVPRGKSQILFPSFERPWIEKPSPRPLILLEPTILSFEVPHVALPPVIKLWPGLAGPDPGGGTPGQELENSELDRYCRGAIVREVVPQEATS
jgi:hypothetical protein